MGYTHIEVTSEQIAKRPESPCGDVVAWRRAETATTLVLGDGLGSGIKANVAAHFCVARLFELLRLGHSLRESFASLVRTMNEARRTEMPFTAFSVARILSNGETTILSYDSPPPILAVARHASVLRQRFETVNEAVVGEAHARLSPGDGVLLVSDGVTWSGLGRGYPEGWTIEGVARFARDQMAEVRGPADLAPRVIREARRLAGDHPGDDCTAAVASSRVGIGVNLLTGPPLHREDDAGVVRRFLDREGAKVVCGATTARIVARQLGRKLEVEQNAVSAIAPPLYRIEGIDLVTEGAVSLNQVYNILDAEPSALEPDTGVTRLCGLLKSADRIAFMVGRAPNLAAGDIAFRQQGIIDRQGIVPLLARILEAQGRLVLIESF